MSPKHCASMMIGWAVALLMLAAPGVQAQTPIQPIAAATCATPDRSDLGQYAWGMALRWGTPELLDQLVRKNCIDPNAWQQLGVDQAPMINQVRNAALLSKALSLGWRPIDQVLNDRRRNPFYLNPLLSKMIRPQAVDDEALAMFKQAQAKYNFTLSMSDRPSSPDEHETMMIALASIMPSSLINEPDRRTGLTPLIAAAAGKYDRLVSTLIKQGASWKATYTPMGLPPARGVWDAAFDGSNCVLSQRIAQDGALTPLDVLNRQDRSIAALHEVWNPSVAVSISIPVRDLNLDMVTGQALWLKPSDWAILQNGVDLDKVIEANKRAQEIQDLQKSRNKRWDYTTLMGTAVPDSVCLAVQQH